MSAQRAEMLARLAQQLNATQEESRQLSYNLAMFKDQMNKYNAEIEHRNLREGIADKRYDDSIAKEEERYRTEIARRDNLDRIALEEDAEDDAIRDEEAKMRRAAHRLNMRAMNREIQSADDAAALQKLQLLIATKSNEIADSYAGRYTDKRPISQTSTEMEIKIGNEIDKLSKDPRYSKFDAEIKVLRAQTLQQSKAYLVTKTKGLIQADAVSRGYANDGHSLTKYMKKNLGTAYTNNLIAEASKYSEESQNIWPEIRKEGLFERSKTMNYGATMGSGALMAGAAKLGGANLGQTAGAFMKGSSGAAIPTGIHMATDALGSALFEGSEKEDVYRAWTNLGGDALTLGGVALAKKQLLIQAAKSIVAKRAATAAGSVATGPLAVPIAIGSAAWGAWDIYQLIKAYNELGSDADNTGGNPPTE